ncbi:hypothetical protein ABZ093_17110, partial [Streptomyces cyaneofuscatus]
VVAGGRGALACAEVKGDCSRTGGGLAVGDELALVERIAERRAGVGDPRALVGELRRSLVLVPYDRGGLWTAVMLHADTGKFWSGYKLGDKQFQSVDKEFLW